jgi:hypothetical protein
MPSDDRVRDALNALTGPAQAFRSTLARTADGVGQLVRVRAATKEARAARFAAELGTFAGGRIAVDRLAQTFEHQPSVNGGAAAVLRRSHETLVALLNRGEDLFLVTVDQGTSLRDAVATRLADLGRAFGAARVARDAQSGAATDRHAPALERFPFAQWNRAERNVAPPLVIDVRGADLWAAGLAEFLDGHLKLVLVVTGDASPAPLARLITPNVYVQQASAASELAGLSASDGPGVAALVPDTAARFTHDPKAGRSPSERLRVAFMPAAAPRKAIDGISAPQQADELAMLAALTQPMAPATEARAGAAATADPADLLAAWLLAQTHAGS